MIGLIGKKIGMTQIFSEDGTVAPVTLIKVEPNTVVAERIPEKDGYNAVVLGAFDAKESKVSKPYAGQFKETINPKQKLVEFRDFEAECKVGDNLDLSILKDFTYVDVIGTSKGKGYQGVIKRHGFRGGRKSHGSKFHREAGSTGQAASPSKVVKGTKMAGRMGGTRTTIQNLRVVRLDEEKHLILVRGVVPGRKDSFVLVTNAKKKT